jgi:hypothetical protein
VERVIIDHMRRYIEHDVLNDFVVRFVNYSPKFPEMPPMPAFPTRPGHTALAGAIAAGTLVGVGWLGYQGAKKMGWVDRTAAQKDGQAASVPAR